MQTDSDYTNFEPLELPYHLTQRYYNIFQLNIMMSVKDSIGGWKDNAYLYSAPKGCTEFKKLMGSQWNAYMDNFGIKQEKDVCRIDPVICIN